MKKYSITAAALVLLLATTSYCAVKYKTTGVYTDSGGVQHSWSVTDEHTMVWDGSTYLPVGTVFTPKCITDPEELADDVALLDTYRSAGITDVLVKMPLPVTASSPENFQSLIDALEAAGMSYGIYFNDTVKSNLTGNLINPAVYRMEGPHNDSRVICDLKNTDGAYYRVLRTYDNSVKSSGVAGVYEGSLIINIPGGLAAGEVLLVYPHMKFDPGGDKSMGDVWSGFDEYRDRLIAYFRKIKFGSGLRFFYDPLPCKQDYSEVMNSFLPDSGAFRLGFESHLIRRYTHEGAVNAAWGILDNLPSVAAATEIMPLWANGRGSAFLYNPKTMNTYSADVTMSRVWNDIIDYRDTSAQSYLNAMADALRNQVANVPVIYRCGSYHRIYANPFSMSGFDGLAAPFDGTDTAVVETGVPTYSLAEESAKTMAFFTVADAGGVREHNFNHLWGAFFKNGAKGFFAEDLSPIELAAFKNLIPADQAAYKPEVIFFPYRPHTGARIRQFDKETWWMPTLRSGKTSYMGEGIYAYSIAGEDRVCVWTTDPNGRTITLKTPQQGLPKILFPADVKPVTNKKSDRFTLTLGSLPVVMTGMDISMVFPFETAEKAIADLDGRKPSADKAGLDIKKIDLNIESAKRVLSNGQAMIAYDMATQAAKDLDLVTGTNIVFEGENATAHGFTGTRAMRDAVNGLALVLDTEDNPPLTPYSAAFAAMIDTTASYELWVACSDLSKSSPVSYTLDDVNRVKIDKPEKTVKLGPDMAWYKLGNLSLVSGKQTIKFRVEGKSPDGKYYFAIDRLILSPTGFDPEADNK
ncbi:MAG: hypothetical protein J6U98_02960 [Abditibacteriota bacterium]|nr:hypothetical protein [Abditibacteriota bacterium]